MARVGAASHVVQPGLAPGLGPGVTLDLGLVTVVVSVILALTGTLVMRCLRSFAVVYTILNRLLNTQDSGLS